MDTVFIEDLRIETVIGIYDWERKIRQVVALDLEMAFDNRKPAASDRIEDTLDYKAVSKRLITFRGKFHFSTGGNAGRALRRNRAERIRCVVAAPQIGQARRGARLEIDGCAYRERRKA